MKLLKLFLVVFLQIFIKANPIQDPSILIIGAGSAGIAAATHLLNHNFTNIKVLEAENRIGGRIQSVFFGEAFVDLGAESCHGTEDNIVYKFVKDFNILKHHESPKLVYDSSRSSIDTKLSSEIISVIESVYGTDGHRDEVDGKTLGSYCIRKFNSTIYDKYAKNPEQLEIAKSSIDLLRHIVLENEGAFSWFEPSAKSDYTDCRGDFNLKWNGFGYKTLLEILMKKFPDPSKQLPIDDAILLNKEVTRVLWNPNSSQNGIIAFCSDGSYFKVDHLIFTPSIGVLKEKHESLFSPKLPETKKQAIRSIGFGAVLKVALFFKSKWWESEKNFTGFNFIWNESDRRQVLREFPEGPRKEGRSWLTDFYLVYPVQRNPNILVGWFTGDLVPEIEKMSNETMMAGIEFILRKFLDHKFNISGPDMVIRSSWFSNSNFRGCYSYQTLEARSGNLTAEMSLAEPVVNKYGRPILQFAGEASHPYFYSTVHGAIETGFREAERLIKFYK